MSFLNTITMEQLATRIAAMLFYVALQGAILAALARVLGDQRPRYDGRLTLNPFVHIAVSGFAMAALFRSGWIRPLRFDIAANRFGRAGLVLIAVVGLLIMLALIALSDLLRAPIEAFLPRTAGYSVLYIIQQFQELATASTLLNILPLPGLIGGIVWQAAFPAAERRLERLGSLVMAGLCVLLILGWIPDFSAALLDHLRLI